MYRLWSVSGLCDGEVAAGGGDVAAEAVGGVDPFKDGVAGVADGVLGGFAVGHAAGEVGDRDEPAAAVGGGDWLHDQGVVTFHRLLRVRGWSRMFGACFGRGGLYW